MRVLGLFLLTLMLWGCGNEMGAPVKTIAIKVAQTYCETNNGIEWIKGVIITEGRTPHEVSYQAQFRCKNGLQSDWQEMKEEKPKELLK